MKYAIHPEQKISALKIIECSDAEWAEALATVGDWLNDNGQPRFEDTIPGISERPDLRGVFAWCLPLAKLVFGANQHFRYLLWRSCALAMVARKRKCHREPDAYYLDDADGAAEVIRSLPETDRMIFWTDEPLEIEA